MKLKNFTFEITKVNPFGEMTLKFSEDLNIEFFKKFLNSTYIDIYIEQKTEVDEPARNLNLTWNVTSFESDLLEI